MLDEIFDSDSNSGRRGDRQERRSGIRGVIDRLLGLFGEDDEDRRMAGDRRSGDLDEDGSWRRDDDRRRRRDDRDGFDFGDD